MVDVNLKISDWTEDAVRGRVRWRAADARQRAQRNPISDSLRSSSLSSAVLATSSGHLRCARVIPGREPHHELALLLLLEPSLEVRLLPRMMRTLPIAQ